MKLVVKRMASGVAAALPSGAGASQGYAHQVTGDLDLGHAAAHAQARRLGAGTWRRAQPRHRPSCWRLAQALGRGRAARTHAHR